MRFYSCYKGLIRGSVTAETGNSCHLNIQLLYSIELFNHRPPCLNYRSPVSVDGGIICWSHGLREPPRRSETLILPWTVWPSTHWQTLAGVPGFSPHGWWTARPTFLLGQHFLFHQYQSWEKLFCLVKHLLLHCGLLRTQTNRERDIGLFVFILPMFLRWATNWEANEAALKAAQLSPALAVVRSGVFKNLKVVETDRGRERSEFWPRFWFEAVRHRRKERRRNGLYPQ